MKKIIAVLVSALLMLSCTITAFAETADTATPDEPVSMRYEVISVKNSPKVYTENDVTLVDYPIYDYDDDYEEDEPVKPKSSFRKDKKKAEEDDYEEDHSIHEKAVKSSPKVTPIRPVKKQGGSGMEVCVIKPTSVEDAREITETLLNNRTVVLNVEGLDTSLPVCRCNSRK